MLAEILYRIRRSLPDLGRLLGSWRLSVLLMVVAALYQGLLGVFSFLSAPAIVQRISQLIPFWLVWALLLVNTGVCLWRRFPALIRDLRREPATARTPAAKIFPVPDDWTTEQAEEKLRSFGFRRVRRLEGGVWGLRHRWAPLGTYVFHGALFLLALAVALTMAARQEFRIWVAEGETFTGAPAQILSRSHSPLRGSTTPAVGFIVDSITPEFWQDMLLFTKLESDLGLPNGGRVTTRINRPLWVGFSSFLRLSGFGYAVRYAISDREGNVLDSLFVKMDVFPPGKSDYFSPERFPHRIEIEVIPDAVVQDGKSILHSLNLANPVVIARVSRGKVLIAEGALQQGEVLEFEGLLLRFPELRYWGEYSIVDDPGLPVLWLAFVAAVIGLLLKVRGGRTEALWTPGPEGQPGRVELWGPAAHLPENFGAPSEGS
jgi:hypothetical protein